ncbi:MAG: energy-coupling factor transporter transmembrane protein EcfT [Actinomycetales bacterium]|nr:energy-coupling factor transporter transmembrane protein EcfT [Actinomycetales bacterium]
MSATETIRSGNRVRDLNPATQVLGCLVLAVVALLFGLVSMAAVVVVCFVLAAAAGRFVAFVSTWAKTVLVLSLVIVALQTMFIPGEEVWWEWGPLSATGEGFRRGTLFASRIMGAATPLVLLVQLVDLRRLVLEMERRGISPKVTYVFVATVNIIPQMRDRMGVIMDAQRARGVETDANWWVRIKAFFPTIGPLIISSIVGVEEKAITLEARGFTATGPRTSLYSIQDTGVDRVLRVGAWVLLAVVVVGRVVLWLR